MAKQKEKEREERLKQQRDEMLRAKIQSDPKVKQLKKKIKEKQE